jgi:hypothetical protein
MTNQAFEKGFTVLTQVFPSMKFDARLFWEMLHDLDGQFFLMAIWELIKNIKELYPGTNVIAVIRSRAEELRIEVLKNSTLKLEVESETKRIERWKKEASPMPEECKVALAKLGIKILKEV